MYKVEVFNAGKFVDTDGIERFLNTSNVITSNAYIIPGNGLEMQTRVMIIAYTADAPVTIDEQVEIVKKAYGSLTLEERGLTGDFDVSPDEDTEYCEMEDYYDIPTADEMLEYERVVTETKISGAYDNSEIYADIDSPFYGIIIDCLKMYPCPICQPEDIPEKCVHCGGTRMVPLIPLRLGYQLMKEEWFQRDYPDWDVHTACGWLQGRAWDAPEYIWITARKSAKELLGV